MKMAIHMPATDDVFSGDYVVVSHKVPWVGPEI